MAGGLTVRIIGGEEFDRGLSRASPRDNPRVTSDTLERVARLVGKVAAEEKIVRGRSHLPPADGFLTFREGGAAGSIGVDLGGLPREAVTGSILVYPLLHEFGLGTPKRPWLDPAIGDVVPGRAENLAAQFWEQAVGSAS